jgi:hypothetical protein
MRAVQVDHHAHHDARAHQRGKAAPWFALALVAFVTALKIH